VTLSSWLAALQALLPPGRALTREPSANLTRFLEAIAAMFLAAQLRLEALLQEMDPLRATTMLPDWERLLGLPDECAPTASLSIAERQRLTNQRLLEQGGASRQYFIDVAEQLGEPNSWIDEFRQANCNSNCNAALHSLADAFTWRVNFRRAASGNRPGNCNDTCNDAVYLVEPALAECPIQERKPAHTKVIFAYAVTSYGPADLQAYHTRATKAWAFNASGVLQEFAPNILRVVPSPAGVMAALREPESTNLLRHSGDLSNAAWVKFDQSLPGNRPNLLPADVEPTTSGGSWLKGANLTRIGTIAGPPGVANAVVYEAPAGLPANVWLNYQLPAALANSNRYKLAIWARVVSGSVLNAGTLAAVESDFDGVAGNERRQININGSGLDGEWRRFFLEFTTGALASTHAKSVYLLADWGGANGAPARIAITEPRLVDTQGQPDFANITLNDPVVQSPDGGNTAMKVVLKDYTSTTLFLRQFNPGLSAGNYKPSIFVRSPGNAFGVSVNDDSAGASASVPAAPGWQRIAFDTFVKGAGPDMFDFEFATPFPFWVWLPQLEPGTVMTSPIISGATPGVRARDEISIPVDVKAGEAHSQLIDFAMTDTLPGVASRLTGDNALGIYINPSPNRVAAVWNGSTNVGTPNAYALGTRGKVAASCDAAGRSIVLNGGTVASDAATSGAMSRVLLGQTVPGSDSQAPAVYIHEFRTYRWRLSDAELQAATA